MIGILLITHGSLGKSLLESAGHVLGGPLDNVAEIGVNACTSIEKLQTKALQAITHIDRGKGVLVLTDMYGGSPSNITKNLINKSKVRGVSGVNLPMLIRALTYRNKSLDVVAEKAVSGGNEGVLKIPVE